MIPTPPSKPRPTTAACPSSRNVLSDEHNAFQGADVIKTFGEPPIRSPDDPRLDYLLEIARRPGGT